VLTFQVKVSTSQNKPILDPERFLTIFYTNSWRSDPAWLNDGKFLDFYRLEMMFVDVCRIVTLPMFYDIYSSDKSSESSCDLVSAGEMLEA